MRLTQAVPTLFFALACIGRADTIQGELIVRMVNQLVTAIPDGPNQMFDLDIDQNGTTDLTFRSIIGLPEDPTFASFADIVPPFATINGVVIDSATGDGFPTISRLGLGDTISSARLFSGNNDFGNLSSQFSPDAATGNFQNQTGYIGLRFERMGETYYGFAQITVNDLQASQDPLAILISKVGFETVAGMGATIVPEPGALSLLATAFAIGLATFACRRLKSRRAA